MVVWDNKAMARPPIGAVTMRHTVKFRLSDADMDDLREIAGGPELSETLRRLIREEKKRKARRER
jgi:hypothetical protein